MLIDFVHYRYQQYTKPPHVMYRKFGCAFPVHFSAALHLLPMHAWISLIIQSAHAANIPDVSFRNRMHQVQYNDKHESRIENQIA